MSMVCNKVELIIACNIVTKKRWLTLNKQLCITNHLFNTSRQSPKLAYNAQDKFMKTVFVTASALF